MLQKCSFNPLRDIEETIPDLVVDVSEVMRTGVVASTGTLAPYSKEDDVNAVGHYLKDKIQTVLAAKALDASMARAARLAAAATPAAPVATPASPSVSQPASGE